MSFPLTLIMSRHWTQHCNDEVGCHQVTCILETNDIVVRETENGDRMRGSGPLARNHVERPSYAAVEADRLRRQGKTERNFLDGMGLSLMRMTRSPFLCSVDLMDTV